MINQEIVEKIYDIIDESCVVLYNKLKMNYFDSLLATCKNIMNKEISQDFDEEELLYLKDLYSYFYVNKFDAEDIRKAMQYLFIKTFKEMGYQNVVTPDSISFLIAYLLKKMFKGKMIKILDPFVGSGNLLLSLVNNYEHSEAIGIDNDEQLIRLAQLNANMQEKAIPFYIQDPFTYKLDNIDVIVSDIKDIDIKRFISNYILSLADDGVMMLVISHKKIDLIDKKLMYGIIDLPKTYFKNDRKSIVIIKNKKSKDKKFLLGIMPDGKNLNETKKFMENLDQWFNKEEEND